MPIAAHFEPIPHSDDPRYAVRYTLRLEATGATADGETTRVTVHNVSAGGLLIETAAMLAIGEAITLDLPEAGGRRATVTWASGTYYGCQFDTPLSSAELSGAQLRSEAPVPRPALSALDDDFGHRLQRLRKQRGMTLAQIADRLGVSKPTVWAWEQGRSRPVGNRIDPLAEALGVARSELYPDVGDRSHLHDLLARARAEIATAAGSSPDKIRILIEL
ncbi:helix-turn-helix domain-containing protein [Novosphingobium sp. Gsoil 351]|uniref:helix-turn-helix domain-containing protein n=1 Tax=Novosphingobium sp. Gsoil 351 TaxID=2675225 RepID=UPI0012B4969D|nr:helix-turn-helix domain-containing protein [Novosphingobium sp. Gsoil 351]QGN56069.1 helix-turn-helix domain-containing protein [Novosphingobium sp. Gsoil 351]